MSTTVQFEKEFDPSYTIPRRKNESEQDEGQLKSILANAYGAPVDTSTRLEYANSTATTSWEKVSQPSPDSFTNPLKRTWFDANSTPANKVYKDTFNELYDLSLPSELLLLFQPLFCKLCMFQLSGNSMAKLHYQSKNHDKKVRTWLIGYSERTGQPLHKRATMPRLKKGDADYDPKHFYCEVCDLPLTGKVHAESHYMGKNHQRAVIGMKNPAGKGFYNEDGKWTRISSAKKPTGDQDNFGQDFNNPKEVKEGKEFLCDVCDLKLTSLMQLEVHQGGSKHKKKLRILEDAKHLEMLIGNDQENGIDAPLNIPEDFPTSLSVEGDLLASYRTPSGQYYCKSCNISLNSEMQFMQHLNSKKHSKKLNSSNVPSSTEATTYSSVLSADDIFAHL